MKFETVLTLEPTVEVTGTYHRARRGYVPRGEYLPIEPDEREYFWIDTVTVSIGGKTIDLMPLLDDAQRDAIAQEGIAAAHDEEAAAREAAYEARRDR